MDDVEVTLFLLVEVGVERALIVDVGLILLVSGAINVYCWWTMMVLAPIECNGCYYYWRAMKMAATTDEGG